MSKNINDLIDKKDKIYASMLTLLEQLTYDQYSINTQKWNPTIIGDIEVITINPLNIQHNLERINGLTLHQAMKNSFSRISKNNLINLYICK